MKTKTIATFVVVSFLMVFFSYALVAQAKRVYQGKKNHEFLLVIHAQSAYVTKRAESKDTLLTLSSVSPQVTCVQKNKGDRCFAFPLETLIKQQGNKKTYAQLIGVTHKEESLLFQFSNGVYNPLKEELTFIVNFDEAPFDGIILEPALIFSLSDPTLPE